MSNPPFSFKSKVPGVLHKIAGSLALRILAVSIALLVFPLLVQSLLVYKRDYQLKLHDFGVSLDMIAQAEAEKLNQFITGKRELLKILAQIGEIPKKNLYGFSSLQFVSNGQEGTRGKALWLKESSEKGTLLGSIDEKQLLQASSAFIKPLYPFETSLIAEDGSIFATTHKDSNFAEKTVLFAPHLLVKGIASFPSLAETSRIGVRIGLGEAPLLLQIDAAETEVSNFSSHGILSHLMSFFLWVLILGGIVTAIVARRMARPLKALYFVMESVSEGALHTRYKQDSMGFEINILGGHLNRMLDSLILHMEEAKKERIQREVLASELKIGHEIQRSLFPYEIPQFQGVEMAAGFLPAREVAGDFYDVFVAGDRLLIVIADASGKGVSACLYSLGVRSMLRSFSHSLSDLATIVRHVNQLFCQDTGDTGAFVTAWIAVYDAATKQLDYCCCGHPPALLLRKGEPIKEIKTEGMALGVDLSAPISVKTIQLVSDDQLLLYTDGILEAHDDQGKWFGQKRLYQAADFYADSDPSSLAEGLLKEVKEFSSHTTQHDDITLLVLKIIA